LGSVNLTVTNWLNPQIFNYSVLILRSIHLLTSPLLSLKSGVLDIYVYLRGFRGATSLAIDKLLQFLKQATVISLTG